MDMEIERKCKSLSLAQESTCLNVENDILKIETWPALVLHGCTSEDVARDLIEGGLQSEPFYLFDMDEVYKRIQHFKHKMPRIDIFYAMKANDHELMLKLCLALNVGFDCASSSEINKVRLLRNIPQSIIYAVPSKTPTQMTFARNSGVTHTTFDSSYELHKTKQYWPDARLLLRIIVEGDSVYKLGEKFGCHFETEAIGLLDEAAALGLAVVGVAFHVGSICMSNESYVQGLQRIKILFEHEAKAGRKMHIVDIGGGFLGDRTDGIDQVAELINRVLEDLFPSSEVQVIAEPGRYLCESAFDLYMNINNVRRVNKNGKELDMIYLNDGIYGTMSRFAINGSVHKFKRSNPPCPDDESDELEEVMFWGPSCDSIDQVWCNATTLLPRCSPADWLVFPRHGAYSLTLRSKFSSLEIPRVRPIVSAELWNKLQNIEPFSKADFTEQWDIPGPSQVPILTALPRVTTSQPTLLI